MENNTDNYALHRALLAQQTDAEAPALYAEAYSPFTVSAHEENQAAFGMFQAIERSEAPENLSVMLESAGDSVMDRSVPMAFEFEAPVFQATPIPPVSPVPPIATLPPGTFIPPVTQPVPAPIPPVSPVPPIATLPPGTFIPPVTQPRPPVIVTPPRPPVTVTPPRPPVITVPRPPVTVTPPRPPVITLPRPPVITLPTPAPSCPSNHIRLAVPAGQTFPNILIRHGVSFGALQSANPGVNLTALRGGQILCVPPSGTRGLCPSCNGITHTISRNETIDGIARHYRTTLANILRGNPNLAPQDFTVGRTICIPR